MRATQVYTLIEAFICRIIGAIFDSHNSIENFAEDHIQRLARALTTFWHRFSPVQRPIVGPVAAANAVIASNERVMKQLLQIHSDMKMQNSTVIRALQTPEPKHDKACGPSRRYFKDKCRDRKRLAIIHGEVVKKLELIQAKSSSPKSNVESEAKQIQTIPECLKITSVVKSLITAVQDEAETPTTAVQDKTKSLTMTAQDISKCLIMSDQDIPVSLTNATENEAESLTQDVAESQTAAVQETAKSLTTAAQDETESSTMTDQNIPEFLTNTENEAESLTTTAQDVVDSQTTAVQETAESLTTATQDEAKSLTTAVKDEAESLTTDVKDEAESGTTTESSTTKAQDTAETLTMATENKAESLTTATQDTNTFLTTAAQDEIDSLTIIIQDTDESQTMIVQNMSESLTAAVEDEDESLTTTAQNEAESTAAQDEIDSLTTIRDTDEPQTTTVQDMTESSITNAQDTAETLITATKNEVESLTTAAKDETESLTTAIQDADESKTMTVQDMTEYLTTAVQDMTESLTTDVKDEAESLATDVKDEAESLATDVKDEAESLIAAAQDETESLTTVAQDEIESLITTIQAMTESLTTTAKDISESLTLTSEGESDSLTTIAQDTTESSVREISNMVSTSSKLIDYATAEETSPPDLFHFTAALTSAEPDDQTKDDLSAQSSEETSETCDISSQVDPDSGESDKGIDSKVPDPSSEVAKDPQGKMKRKPQESTSPRKRPYPNECERLQKKKYQSDTDAYENENLPEPTKFVSLSNWNTNNNISEVKDQRDCNEASGLRMDHYCDNKDPETLNQRIQKSIEAIVIKYQNDMRRVSSDMKAVCDSVPVDEDGYSFSTQDSDNDVIDTTEMMGGLVEHLSRFMSKRNIKVGESATNGNLGQVVEEQEEKNFKFDEHYFNSDGMKAIDVKVCSISTPEIEKFDDEEIVAHENHIFFGHLCAGIQTGIADLPCHVSEAEGSKKSTNVSEIEEQKGVFEEDLCSTSTVKEWEDSLKDVVRTRILDIFSSVSPRDPRRRTISLPTSEEKELESTDPRDIAHKKIESIDDLKLPTFVKEIQPLDEKISKAISSQAAEDVDCTADIPEENMSKSGVESEDVALQEVIVIPHLVDKSPVNGKFMSEAFKEGKSNSFDSPFEVEMKRTKTNDCSKIEDLFEKTEIRHLSSESDESNGKVELLSDSLIVHYTTRDSRNNSKISSDDSSEETTLSQGEMVQLEVKSFQISRLEATEVTVDDDAECDSEPAEQVAEITSTERIEAGSTHYESYNSQHPEETQAECSIVEVESEQCESDNGSINSVKEAFSTDSMTEADSSQYEKVYYHQHSEAGLTNSMTEADSKQHEEDSRPAESISIDPMEDERENERLTIEEISIDALSEADRAQYEADNAVECTSTDSLTEAAVSNVCKIEDATLEAIGQISADPIIAENQATEQVTSTNDSVSEDASFHDHIVEKMETARSGQETELPASEQTECDNAEAAEQSSGNVLDVSSDQPNPVESEELEIQEPADAKKTGPAKPSHAKNRKKSGKHRRNK